MKAIEEFQRLKRFENDLSAKLKAAPEEIPAKIAKLSERVRELEKEISRVKSQAAMGGGKEDYLTKVKEIKGVKVLVLEVEIDDAKALREFSDQVKSRLGSGISVVASKAGGKVSIIVTVSKDLAEKYHAGNIIRELAAIVGGKGGGRPDMAQAGGSDTSKLPEALNKVYELVS
ncbi:MAG: hypothetical protein ACD_73C00722G0002, partial [uncultured bacterium]